MSDLEVCVLALEFGEEIRVRLVREIFPWRIAILEGDGSATCFAGHTLAEAVDQLGIYLIERNAEAKQLLAETRVTHEKAN